MKNSVLAVPQKRIAVNGERFAKGICHPSKSQIKKMANYFPPKRMLTLGFGGQTKTNYENRI